MSKRKHKNKFRFQPQAMPPAAGVDMQSQLPLAPTEVQASAPLPVAIATGEAVQADPEPGLPVAAEPAPAAEMRLTAPVVAIDTSLGQRLRAAREARGLSCEAVSHVLKLPVTIVKALEAEQFERIGHGVFLRGYLSKYLQLLDLPQILAERVVQDHSAPPALTTNGTISHPRYLFERYSGSALYVILTGVIIVPAVLVALRVGFDQNLARITPLDAPPPAVAAPATGPAAIAAVAAAHVVQSVPTPIATPAATKPEETPLVASMTPFPAAAESRVAATAAPVAKPANRLHLSLTQASWVEIADSDGKKLEYGLLPAGSERDYASDLALDVRIGNADGASLTVDGKVQDLSLFRRANVAHLKVADGTASTGLGSG